MKLLIAVAITAAFVLFVDANATENDMFLEANNEIDLMKKKGATEADCKDLAKTSCKEVEKERATDQKLINKQKTGRHCVNLGQGGIRKATLHWKKTKKTWLSYKVKVTKAANFRVHFASQRFRTMKPGHCGFIFGSRNYLTARAKYNRATKMEIAWKSRTSESWKMVLRMKMVAARMVQKCYCTTKNSYYRVYKTVTKTTRIARQNKAHAKCKMMACVLNGTPLKSSKCRGKLTKIRKLKLYVGAEKARCLTVRRRV